MIGALKYEVVRIKTIASSYWMSGMAIFFTAGITLLMALTVSASDIDEMSVKEVTTYVVLGGASGPIIPVMAAPFFAVMGAMAVGHEYRYGTNRATLSAIPDRVAVLLAKLIVLLAWVVATVVLLLLLTMAITWIFLSNPEFGGHMFRPMLNYTGYCAGFAAAGLGLAALVRNQTGAIVAVLVWPLVVEPILYGIATFVAQSTDAGIGKLTNLLPASAGRRTMFDPYELLVGFGTSSNVWDVALSALVFWIGVVVAVAAGAASFITRDA